MDIFNTLKAKADANGDGKIDMSDLEGLKDQMPAEQFDKLKEMADGNGDGKLSLDDLKSVNLNDLGNSAKDMLGGFFGKK